MIATAQTALMREKRRLLILGGTGEAATLAREAHGRFGARLHVVTSLAGRTREPAALAGETRIGGFGGAVALAEYLRGEAIDLVVDATHPFAAKISAAARIACEAADVPRLVLARPVWRPQAGDRWIEAADAVAAAALVPEFGTRVFLTVGRRDLAAFAGLPGCRFLIRLVELPPEPPPFRPGSFELVIARGPFTADAERALMSRHGIDVVVAKASGGAATEAKLIAARELNRPVIMLRRPPAEPGQVAERIDEALQWIERALDGLDAAARKVK